MNGLEETIGTNGFSMVFGLSTIGPDGFLVWQPLGSMVFGLATIGLNGFSMVANHWSNDGMVTIHRYGLPKTNAREKITTKENKTMTTNINISNQNFIVNLKPGQALSSSSIIIKISIVIVIINMSSISIIIINLKSVFR